MREILTRWVRLRLTSFRSPVSASDSYRDRSETWLAFGATENICTRSSDTRSNRASEKPKGTAGKFAKRSVYAFGRFGARGRQRRRLCRRAEGIPGRDASVARRTQA